MIFFLERHLMLIFFFAVLFPISVFSCTPPYKETAIPSSPRVRVAITTVTESSAPIALAFDPLLEDMVFKSPLLLRQPTERTISPRREARIKKEEKIALANTFFEWPGSSAPVRFNAAAFHQWITIKTNETAEFMCPQ